MQSNPAMLPYMEHTEVGIAYCTNYNVTDITCARISAGTKGNTFSYGLSTAVFGNSHFRESNYSFALARTFYKNNSFALCFDLTRRYQEEYKARHYVYPELAYYTKSGKLSLGIHAINPIDLFKQNDDITSMLKLRSTYNVVEPVQISFLYAQSNDGIQYVSLGASYSIQDKILCCISYTNNESPLQLAVQFPLWKCLFTYEAQYHFYLGLCHTTEIVISL
ncbi:MAG: hypothetical protein MJ197_06560 [Bacteroidales bacterium]|nr:hypothetical protein [Bacteroidales bacterium]